MAGHIGRQVRRARLIDPATGRGFCVAFDHALQFGPFAGGEHPEATLEMMADSRG